MHCCSEQPRRAKEYEQRRLDPDRLTRKLAGRARSAGQVDIGAQRRSTRLLVIVETSEIMQAAITHAYLERSLLAMLVTSNYSFP